MSESLRLYAWQPKGHGELSWFVMASNEEEAKAAVDREIKRRLALEWPDPDHITGYEVQSWGTDYFRLTVLGVGEPIENSNE